MNSYKIWFKGEMLDKRDASISVLSPTAQFGLNVFEGIRCYWSSKDSQLYAFRLHDHLSRLVDSTKLIRMPCPFNLEQLQHFFLESIVYNKLKENIAVRMTLFIDGEGTWHSEEMPSMFISPIPTRINELIGRRACISSWERINDNSMPPRIKCGANYISGRYAHLDARKAGFDLPIMLNDLGHVAEGAGACVFIIRNNKLITPPFSASILESITRSSIIEFSEDLGLSVIERDVGRTELYISDEVFLCGSAAEITPITSVDNIKIGLGEVGPITKLLHQRYIDIVTGGVDKYIRWLTPVYPN